MKKGGGKKKRRKNNLLSVFPSSLFFFPVLCGLQFVEGMSEKENGTVGRESSPQMQCWWLPAQVPFVTSID